MEFIYQLSKLPLVAGLGRIADMITESRRTAKSIGFRPSGALSTCETTLQPRSSCGGIGRIYIPAVYMASGA
ncbi:hypothetical protein GCM10027088_10310 [Nocardia goodfellowii]